MVVDQMGQTPWRVDPLPAGRRALDTAVGILVGLRRCGVDVAFQELIDAGRRHDISVFALASALVDLASRAGRSRSGGAADRAACHEWDELLTAHVSSRV